MVRTRFTRSVFFSLLIAAAVGLTGAANSQENQNLPSSELQPTEATGVPEGVPPEEWMAASGTAMVQDQNQAVDTIMVEAENLVPEGTYTVWWADDQAALTPVVGLSTGPNEDLPDNAFTADAQGNAQVRILAASNPPYQRIVIALHTGGEDAEVEDEQVLADNVFQHLQGPWPRS